MKSWVRILDIGIGKAEGILANQREEQRRWEGSGKKREGQWGWERKTAEMREEGENRLKIERAGDEKRRAK